MQGTLREEALANVIRTLYVGRKSGILHLTQGDVRKRIYFEKGSMVFANSDVDEDRLGQYLIRAGKLETSQFEMAMKVSRETGARFGRTVVEMGHTASDEMETLVCGQIEAIIYSLFAWGTGEYRFEQRENSVDEDIKLNLSTADIILEGTRRMNSPEAIQRSLGGPKRVLRATENPLLLYQKVSLTPSEGFVFSRVVDGNEPYTVADIASLSPLGEEETLRCIYGLVSAGLLELEGGKGAPPARPAAERVAIPRPETTPREPEAKPEPTGPSPEEKAIREDIVAKHASLATANHYDLLGITITASEPEIKKAYYAMAKKYHPDRHHSPYLQDVHTQLEELFVKITDAYQTLSNELERRRYDSRIRTESPRGEGYQPGGIGGTGRKPMVEPGPSPTEKMAENRYREGKRLYEEMSFFDAIQCLREAVRLDPGKGQYHRMLAKALMKNPNWRKDAEEHFTAALGIDQFDTEAMIGLGEIYEAEGMQTRADKMWKQVLSYDAQNEIALEKTGAKKKGTMAGLRNMLRRKKE